MIASFCRGKGTVLFSDSQQPHVVLKDEYFEVLDKSGKQVKVSTLVEVKLMYPFYSYSMTH